MFISHDFKKLKSKYKMFEPFNKDDLELLKRLLNDKDIIYAQRENFKRRISNGGEGGMCHVKSRLRVYISAIKFYNVNYKSFRSNLIKSLYKESVEKEYRRDRIRTKLRKKHKRNKKYKKICKGKVAHKSEKHAKIALSKALKDFGTFHYLNTYKCPYCGKWHIGRTRTVLYSKFDDLLN